VKYSIIALGLCLGAYSGHAQVLPVKTTFYTVFSDSAVVTEEAIYKVKRTEVPAQSRIDSVFYVASKRLMRVQATTWQPAGDTLITTTYWRANGKRSGLDNSSGIKKHREHLTFDTEGRTRQKTVWEGGKEISAECYSETGTPVPCAEYQYVEKMPVYPGGQQALLQYVVSTTRYPREALKKNQQGRVFVTFVVDETGYVRYARIKKGVSPELDAEALRVMNGLARFEPAQQNGETVPVHFTVPVTFAIKDGSRRSAGKRLPPPDPY
jgi:TonB family protein